LQLLQPGYSPAHLLPRPAGPQISGQVEKPEQDQTAMLSALLTALTRHHARARAIAILERFDDHRLRDIGIARDQIEMFVAGKI
jgi:uncharacterized protein YjiS (DUF1127 family)